MGAARKLSKDGREEVEISEINFKKKTLPAKK